MEQEEEHKVTSDASPRPRHSRSFTTLLRMATSCLDTRLDATSRRFDEGFEFETGQICPFLSYRCHRRLAAVWLFFQRMYALLHQRLYVLDRIKIG